MRSIKVLLLFDIPESAKDVFLNAGYEVESVTEPISEEILIKKIADVHVIGLNPRTPISLSEEILRAGHRLLAVACFGMQTQYVDLKICNDMGIAIFNSPYGDSISLAEMVIGLLIGMARELGERNNELHRGIWKKKSLGCHELRGKTLGIVGYGNIGSLVGVLAEGIGMRSHWYRLVCLNLETRWRRCYVRPIL
jgi:D-3-phosphoglycerate dehydrogenase